MKESRERKKTLNKEKGKGWKTWRENIKSPGPLETTPLNEDQSLEQLEPTPRMKIEVQSTKLFTTPEKFTTPEVTPQEEKNTQLKANTTPQPIDTEETHPVQWIMNIILQQSTMPPTTPEERKPPLPTHKTPKDTKNISGRKITTLYPEARSSNPTTTAISKNKPQSNACSTTPQNITPCSPNTTPRIILRKLLQNAESEMKMSKVANKLHPKIALNFSPTKSDKNKELNKFEATTTPPKTAKNVQVTKRTESDHHVEKLELKKSKKVNTYGGRIKASWKELMNIDGALKMVEVLDRGVQKTSKRIKIFEKPKIEKNSIAKMKNITGKK